MTHKYQHIGIIQAQSLREQLEQHGRLVHSGTYHIESRISGSFQTFLF
jgi:hypothetical protein